MSDVVVVGESLGLLVAERAGRLQNQSPMRLAFGGAESNVAIGVSRLGGSSAWIGRLGSDAVGDLILRELHAEKVAVWAARDTTVPTAVMLKERPHPGSSRITYYRHGQAGSRLSPVDISAEVITGARVLHVTGISAGLSASALSAVHHAIDIARDAGVLVSFDVNHRSKLWGSASDAAAAYQGLAARADIIFAGDDEAELLTGVSDVEQQLAALRAFGADHAVVKLGDRGAVASSGADALLSRDAVRVPVVDTVGAGDAFVAGWLTEFTRGGSSAERLDTAIACGAFACTGDGDWESAPTPAGLEWLRAADGDPVSR